MPSSGVKKRSEVCRTMRSAMTIATSTGISAVATIAAARRRRICCRGAPPGTTGSTIAGFTRQKLAQYYDGIETEQAAQIAIENRQPLDTLERRQKRALGPEPGACTHPPREVSHGRERGSTHVY